MDNPDMNNVNTTQNPKKRPVATMSWVILLIGMAAIVFAIYSAQNKPEEAPIETVTSEGVVTQIQQLNRLHTVAFSVDTVITSKQLIPTHQLPLCRKSILPCRPQRYFQYI
ncbi:hypothetical protein [Psychrobacter sp. AOP7-A1-24]|uniref:hypothetical protein n=1 Tax=Psychrobacter sp. AOP7-A1-24 TaxID=3457646 RepID=UPI00402B3E1F